MIPLHVAVAEALQSARWTFAKTMPQSPHEYVTVRDWDQPVPFRTVARFIYDYGRREEFGGQTYKLLSLGNHQYWSMRLIINRRPLLGGAHRLDG